MDTHEQMSAEIADAIALMELADDRLLARVVISNVGLDNRNAPTNFDNLRWALHVSRANVSGMYIDVKKVISKPHYHNLGRKV